MKPKYWVLITNAIEGGLRSACMNDLPERTRWTDGEMENFIDKAMNRVQNELSEIFDFNDEEIY